MIKILMSFSLLMAVLFSFLESVISTLITLTISFLGYCGIMYLMSCNPWGMNLLYIVVASGMFIVFFYMVNVTPEMPMGQVSKKLILTIIITFALTCLMFLSDNYIPVFLNQELSDSSNSMMFELYKFTSLMILFWLLLIVIFFVRLTYNKSGSIRMKF